MHPYCGDVELELMDHPNMHFIHISNNNNSWKVYVYMVYCEMKRSRIQDPECLFAFWRNMSVGFVRIEFSKLHKIYVKLITSCNIRKYRIYAICCFAHTFHINVQSLVTITRMENDGKTLTECVHLHLYWLTHELYCNVCNRKIEDQSNRYGAIRVLKCASTQLHTATASTTPMSI